MHVALLGLAALLPVAPLSTAHAASATAHAASAAAHAASAAAHAASAAAHAASIGVPDGAPGAFHPLARAPRQDPANEEPKAGKRTGVFIGSPHPKWHNRKQMAGQLQDLGGQEMVDRYYKTQNWLRGQVGEEGGVSSSARPVAENALLALVWLGATNTVKSGPYGKELRRTIKALREAQDAETGAIAERASPHFAVDQALALHALSEAYLSDMVEVHKVAAEKALRALLGARAEDGVWHVAGAADAPVDELGTALAAYALFAVKEAALETSKEDAAKIVAWTDSVELGNGDTHSAAVLVARVFAAAVAETSLRDDARTRELSKLLAANAPPPSEPGKPAGEVPAVCSEPLFAYLCTLALYQTDNVAWGRTNAWLIARTASEQTGEGDDAFSWPAAPAGDLPQSRLSTTCLRMLALLNAFREMGVSSMIESTK